MIPDDSLPLKILTVLQQRTDENHPLTQVQLGRLLEREYGSRIPARLLRRILYAIAAFDDNIEFEETARCLPDKSNGTSIRTNFFYRHPFSYSELRLLADSVAFLPYLPASQREQLLAKVRALGSRYFDIRPLLTSPPRQEENRQLFLNIELLDEAIRRGRKISAGYLAYGPDRKLYFRCSQDGSARTYRLSPYRMLMNDGRYYLVCNNEKYDDLSHYRIDRLKDIRLLDDPVRPLRELDPGRKTDTDQYIYEHVYMYSGSCIRARVRLETGCITETMDLFGPAVEFGQEQDGWIPALIRAHPLAVSRFIRSLGAAAVLEEPHYLRREIRSGLQAALELYSE